MNVIIIVTMIIIRFICFSYNFHSDHFETGRVFCQSMYSTIHVKYTLKIQVCLFPLNLLYISSYCLCHKSDFYDTSVQVSIDRSGGGEGGEGILWVWSMDPCEICEHARHEWSLMY